MMYLPGATDGSGMHAALIGPSGFWPFLVGGVIVYDGIITYARPGENKKVRNEGEGPICFWTERGMARIDGFISD